MPTGWPERPASPADAIQESPGLNSLELRRNRQTVLRSRCRTWKKTIASDSIIVRTGSRMARIKTIVPTDVRNQRTCWTDGCSPDSVSWRNRRRKIGSERRAASSQHDSNGNSPMGLGLHDDDSMQETGAEVSGGSSAIPALWYIVGTSLLCEAIVVGFAAWIFCRRDY